MGLFTNTANREVTKRETKWNARMPIATIPKKGRPVGTRRPNAMLRKKGARRAIAQNQAPTIRLGLLGAEKEPQRMQRICGPRSDGIRAKSATRTGTR